jgi:cation transport protein ChaC
MWIFGYGSLIWKTEFQYLEKSIATIDGYKRDFCVMTNDHRGNNKNAGLVLGLEEDFKSVVIGIAYKVCSTKIDIVDKYLTKRELSENAYYPSEIEILLSNNKKVKALTYLVNKSSESYKPKLTDKQKADIISKSYGKSGTNLDYYKNTKNTLIELGVIHEDIFDISKHFQ